MLTVHQSKKHHFDTDMFCDVFICQIMLINSIYINLNTGLYNHGKPRNI